MVNESVGGARIITTLNAVGIARRLGSQREARTIRWDYLAYIPLPTTKEEVPRHRKASYFRRHFLCLAYLLHIRAFLESQSHRINWVLDLPFL